MTSTDEHPDAVEIRTYHLTCSKCGGERTYDVVLQRTEIWVHVISIEADTEEEAMSLAENGEGNDDDDPLFLECVGQTATGVQ